MSSALKWLVVVLAALGGLAPLAVNWLHQPGAEPTLKLPAEVRAEVGEDFELQAQTNCAGLHWNIPADLKLVLPGLQVDPTKRILRSMKAGKYVVTLYGALGGQPSDLASCTVLIGQGPAPVPPGPTPPTPPVPPTPPSDPLVAKLQTAYAADPAAAPIKAGQKVLLIGLAEAMSVHVTSPKLVTLMDLKTDYDAAAKSMILTGALVEVRKVLAAEILSTLGMNPLAKLDPELRPKAVALFQRVAKSLTEVK